ncbi:MAG: hypothetical protein QOD31_4045, partial [Pseudonocardiales bacterium]|nr:hypothetical protein [Pseudonocardiales bacterium]
EQPAPVAARRSRGPGVLALSWALVLEGHDRGTTLHIRLRVAPSGHRWSRAIEVVGGLIDWLTIVALHRGLRERLNKENP